MAVFNLTAFLSVSPRAQSLPTVGKANFPSRSRDGSETVTTRAFAGESCIKDNPTTAGERIFLRTILRSHHRRAARFVERYGFYGETNEPSMAYTRARLLRPTTCTTCATGHDARAACKMQPLCVGPATERCEKGRASYTYATKAAVREPSSAVVVRETDRGDVRSSTYARWTSARRQRAVPVDLIGRTHGSLDAPLWNTIITVISTAGPQRAHQLTTGNNVVATGRSIDVQGVRPSTRAAGAAWLAPPSARIGRNAAGHSERGIMQMKRRPSIRAARLRWKRCRSAG
ncbi:hypothetical protein MRX96_046885 [Rhipicephalus microplus]